MLNSAEREPRASIPLRDFERARDVHRYPIDEVTTDRFPKRADHSKFQETVKPADSGSVILPPSSDNRLKRIMQEVISCFFCISNDCF